jgi:hypothetical protein
MVSRVCFLNNTEGFHAGSCAVMQAFRGMLVAHEVTHWNAVDDFLLSDDTLADCDAVVVNGEGSINRNSRRAFFLLESLQRAQAMGKRTYLLNGIFQAIDPGWEQTLRNIDYICCREPRSADALAAYCGRRAEVLVDFCLAGIADAGQPLMDPVPPVLKGVTWPYSAFHGVLEDLPYPELPVADGISFEDLIATLSRTGLYLTGQHHGVYAAVAAGVPFISVPSNTHKIESLIEWSGLPLPICLTKEQVVDAIANIDDTAGLFCSFFAFMKEQQEIMQNRMTDLMRSL